MRTRSTFADRSQPVPTLLFFPTVDIVQFIEKTVTDANVLGFVETMFGRKRYIPEIHSNNPAIRASAERAAFNFPIQGTEADILKKAMTLLYKYIQSDIPNAAIVLTVHDELVCEVPEKDAQAFAHDMKGIMENIIKLDAPLITDVGIGTTWGDIQGLV